MATTTTLQTTSTMDTYRRYDEVHQEATDDLEPRCWMDALPLEILHREVALRHVWVMSHLALTYPRYARYCRAIYTHMPDDAWRQFAAQKRLKRAQRSLPVPFGRCTVTFIPLPIDHPRAPPQHAEEWRHACRMAAPKSRHQMRQPKQTLQLDGSAIANDNDPLVRWVVHSCIWTTTTATTTAATTTTAASHHYQQQQQSSTQRDAAAEQRLLPAIVPIAHLNATNKLKRDPLRFAAWLRYGVLHRGDGTDQPALIYRDDRVKLHRDGDQPSVIYANVAKCWYRDGKRHRGGDLPAMIYSDGAKCWYRDGKRHRDGDLPAAIYSDGTQWWCRDGKRHRDGDKPAVIYPDGTQIWYHNGKFHRDGDQPAVIYSSGARAWYRNGKQQHRDEDCATCQLL